MVGKRNDRAQDFYVFPRARGTGKPVYYVQFRDPKTRKLGTPKSSGLVNAIAAVKWAQIEYDRMLAESHAPSMSVKEWASQFFLPSCPHVSRLRLEGEHYSERVRENNRRVLERNILTDDDLMLMVLSSVRRSDVLAFRDRVVAKVGRCRTAQVVWACLHIVFREAVYREMVPADPCAGVGRIAYTPKSRAIISLRDISILLDRDRWADELFFRATAIAALSGMRAGEVRALRWRAVSVRDRRIYIEENLPGDSTIVDLPKWGKCRVAPYSGRLMDILEPHRAADDCFVLQRGNGPIGYGKWREALARVVAKANIDVTLHGLRHTLNTHLRASGAKDDHLRGAFGWNSADVHDGYTHRDEYDYSELGQAIDSLLEDTDGQ